MVTSYAFDLLTLVELLFYLFILLFLFIVIKTEDRKSVV